MCFDDGDKQMKNKSGFDKYTEFDRKIVIYGENRKKMRNVK